jgi:hypothetical protein
VPGVQAGLGHALVFVAVATTPAPTVTLAPLEGEARPLEDWVTTFHLVLVVLDPFTHESSWIIDTAGRVLESFTGADCRVGWLVTGSPEQARSFLGPWAEELFTFVDPNREVVASLGLQQLPAIVHLDHALHVVGSAEGWNPAEWRAVIARLAREMSWTHPAIPAPGDPTPYAGAPALG